MQKFIRNIFLIVVVLLSALAIKAILFSVPHETMEIHIYSGNGELNKVSQILNDSQQPDELVNTYNDAGMTPLMLAVSSQAASIELVQLLLDKGAKVEEESQGMYGRGRTALSYAISAGDPEKVALLLRHGADIHYRHDGEYDAIIDAVHGRDITRDSRLLELLKLLVENGANVEGRTEYCESGIRVASNLGRFDAVAFLINAGADEKELRWTPLMKAIALGKLEDINKHLDPGVELEARDSWHRTPWLLAIQTGDVRKTQVLLYYGSDTDARGRLGRPPLSYAIRNGHHEMLQWLLDQGMNPEQHDETGTTALIEAAEYGDLITIDILLAHGAMVDRGKYEMSSEYKERYEESFGGLVGEALSSLDMPLNEETALSYATTKSVALRLLAAGADPARLTREARREIIGFDAETTAEFRLVSLDEYSKGRYRRFGHSNPELTNDPFWIAMIRSGVNAWSATRYFKDHASAPDKPVWCADRFGQSLTLLPDGRMVEIGGEHEDGYDPDFSIYNDVFVYDGRGGIQIYSYQKNDFPPTDFHTATLAGQYIYIIGSLGYDDARKYGITPVYRLSLDDFHIEAMSTTGDMPGWIYDHRASLKEGSRIHITGGKVCAIEGGKELHSPNTKEYVLDLESMVWSLSSP
jgi:ankyrin repeat protein